jgi:hypothetical protein
MSDSGFSFEFNRWVQVADMNNDGKLDFITQPYMNGKRRDGVLSVFYNQSKDSIPSFRNFKKYSVYTLGDPAQFTIGDVNGDGKLDILEPTENYHGQDSNKSIYLYPKGGDHTPDKLYLQNDSSFKSIVFPDNFNTLDGNLYDLNGDGKLKIVIANYSSPKDTDPNHLDSNLLYQYNLQNDSLVKSTFFGASSNSNRYLIRIGQIRSSNKDYNYFPLTIMGNQKEDTIRVLAFKKGNRVSIFDKCDTIANIPIDYITKNGYKYYYTPVNDWGMFVSDLNKDGNLKVITEEFINKYTGPYNIDSMPSSSRIQVYDKTGNISNKYLDSALQYDPQMISNTNGITLTDINGDGLEDILPFAGWGWWSWQHPETAKIDFERLNKRILLNDGTKFKSFKLDLSNQTTDFINQQIGYAYYYPMNLDTSQEKSILIVKGLQSSGINNSLDAVPALKLDYSQFKFPCVINPPKYNLIGKTILCGSSDSSIIKIDSVVGYSTLWKRNNQILSTSNQILVKDSGQVKLTITNLGGCVVEKIFNIVKNPIPSQPILSRDTASYLISNSIIGNTWYKDGTAITDTAQKIKPTTPGSYTVKTTQNGCVSSLSTPYYYLVTDIINLSKDEFIKLAPNPFINQLNFDFNVKGYQKLNIEVYDVATGSKVASQPNLTAGTRITLGQLSAGTYVIRVTSNDNKILYQFKMVKL